MAAMILYKPSGMVVNVGSAPWIGEKKKRKKKKKPALFLFFPNGSGTLASDSFRGESRRGKKGRKKERASPEVPFL